MRAGSSIAKRFAGWLRAWAWFQPPSAEIDNPESHRLGEISFVVVVHMPCMGCAVLHAAKLPQSRLVELRLCKLRHSEPYVNSDEFREAARGGRVRRHTATCGARNGSPAGRRPT